jgi:hypothetical protein
MPGQIRILLWDKPLPTRKEVYAPIAEQLAAFDRHQPSLLAHLSSESAVSVSSGENRKAFVGRSPVRIA